MMARRIWRNSVALEDTVSDILNQAFDLSLKPSDCVAAAKKIQLVFESNSRAESRAPNPPLEPAESVRGK